MVTIIKHVAVHSGCHQSNNNELVTIVEIHMLIIDVCVCL